MKVIIINPKRDQILLRRCFFIPEAAFGPTNQCIGIGKVLHNRLGKVNSPNLVLKSISLIMLNSLEIMKQLMLVSLGLIIFMESGLNFVSQSSSNLKLSCYRCGKLLLMVGNMLNHDYVK